MIVIHTIETIEKFKEKLCVCVLVSQSCLTLCNPMDCSPPDSSVHRILQARLLKWVAISFSRASSWPRDWTSISCVGRRILYHWAIREAPFFNSWKCPDLKGSLTYRGAGFPGGTSGKEPACQCRRLKRTWVRSLGREDPLEEGMATHFSNLAWRITGTEKPGSLQSMWSQRAGQD